MEAPLTKVLLVEDDDTITDIVRYYLEKEGRYQVFAAKNGGEAMALASERFDVALLDIMLPDVNGISLAEQIRTWQGCPIIFISCLNDSDTLINALERGGDDYLVKPFDNRVLDARIQAVLRRTRSNVETASATPKALSCKRFRLDPETQDVVIGRTVKHLLPMEFRILEFLMEHPLHFFTANELYDRIWGKPSYGDVRTVTVQIYNLRKKIEANPKDPKFLINAWGKGYMFDPKGRGYKQESE